MSRPDTVTTGGNQVAPAGVKICNAALYSAAARSRALDIVAVRLVDGDHVGDLDDAFLDPLQVVAAAGKQQHQKEVDHVGDRDLRLADADRLDDDDVEARRLDERHRFARSLRHPAERSRGGRGADEGVLLLRQRSSCASCRRGSSRPSASTSDRRRARRRGGRRR